MLVKSQVKYIQSLGQKKQRDKEELFIAEGPKIIDELIAEIPANIVDLFATEKWIEEHPAASTMSRTTLVTDEELERISLLQTPHQVLAVVRKRIMPPAITVSDQLIPALDTIQDPGNLGTILRLVDWFAIDQVVCNHECADMYNPKVVQASMGSIARVKVFYTDLFAWISEEKNLRVYGASLEGQDIKKIEKLSNGILVIGNESKGISEEIMKLINVKVTIPRKGKAESLNAAMATGIILSHLV